MTGTGNPRRYSLTHLEQLEAESIHIIREVAATFENPVMLYSIGKDSGVMVRLAQKAFAPGPVPFPLLHIDTTWKFREMIAFRDRFCADNGLRLLVHTNQEGLAEGVKGAPSRRRSAPPARSATSSARRSRASWRSTAKPTWPRSPPPPASPRTEATRTTSRR